jgi:WD40 repeat protein
MTGFVTSVAFDPVGNRVLAASIDGRVGVWDAATGALVGRWECHRGPVNSVTVDAGAGHLLTAGHDRSAAVWNLGDGRLVHRVVGLAAGALDAVTVGGHLAVAGFDGSITVWDTADGGGDPVVLTGHREAVTALHALDADTLVSGSRDRSVRVWDLTTGRCQVLDGHDFWVTRLRPVGAHDVVSAGEDGVVIRWTGPGGPAAWRLDVIGEPIWGLGCDAAGRRAVAGAAGITWLVDLAAGTAERLEDLDGRTFRGLAFAPDGRTVALGGDRGRVLLYDLDARAVRIDLDEPVPGPLSLAVSAPDRGVVGRADGAVEVVSGDTRVVVDDAHETFAYSARRIDADRFATGGFDGAARLWNLATGEQVRLDYGSNVFSLSADAAGRRLVVAGGNRVIAWDLGTGAEVWAYEGGGHHGSAAMDAAGTRVATVGESNLLHVHGPGPGDQATWQLPDDYASAVEWVPALDGAPEHLAAVATAYGRVLTVDVETGAVRPLHAEHEDWVRELRVSPDGRYVATTSQNGIGRVFDLQQNTLVGRADLDGRTVLAIDVTLAGEIVALDPCGELTRVRAT